MSRQVVVTLLAVLATGCAAAVRTAQAPAETAGDCSQLPAEIAQSDEARRAALEKQQGAWKAVIPVAVAARYAMAKSELTAADERRATLQQQLEQCRR